jgi:hypothetical protein
MKTYNLTQSTINDKINNFLNSLNTQNDNVGYYVNNDDISDYSSAWDDISDKMNDGNLDVEIIYYANAIEYLSNNDPSLNECMSIASESGYTADNLNSEVLASLLASQNNKEEFQNLENEVTAFFDDLEEEIQTYRDLILEQIDELTEENEDYEDFCDLDLDELTEKANEILK